MKIYDFEVIDRCLLWKKEKTLIIGDLHLGYEEGLMQHGMIIPRNQLNATIKILSRILNKTGRLNKIILLGDVKHYFGKILQQERNDFGSIIKLFNDFLNKDGKIIITAGNHDKILFPITEKYKNVEILDNYILNKILFIHGDSSSIKKSYNNIKNKNINYIVLGHFHPAYILKDKKSIKEEKYKCFLYGYSREYDKNVVFVPSFFPLIEGSDIINDLEIYQKGMKIILITENGKTYSFNQI